MIIPCILAQYKKSGWAWCRDAPGDLRKMWVIFEWPKSFTYLSWIPFFEWEFQSVSQRKYWWLIQTGHSVVMHDCPLFFAFCIAPQIFCHGPLLPSWWGFLKFTGTLTTPAYGCNWLKPNMATSSLHLVADSYERMFSPVSCGHFMIWQLYCHAF